jgi:hypothetical protein
VRDALPGRANIGQLLRWTAALEEIRAYFSVPELFRKIALSEFAARASREVAAYSNFRLLPQPEWLSSATENDEEFGVRTIFPFLVMHKGKPLTLAECRILHEAINQDLSELLPSSASIVRQICHIGQPVGIRDRQVQEAGAIRISADARLVSESWSAANEIGAMEKMRMMTARLRVVLEKIELTVPHIDAIHQCLPSRPAGASST